jgi:RNA 2',3'-cyclic 3'-phosphodiesterase
MPLREFIAIDLPLDLRQAISSQTGSLQHGQDRLAVRWIPVGNLHLTLRFLGDVSEASQDLLEQTLLREAAVHAPFDLALQGLGAFPNPRRARIIWIGVEAPAGLINLQHGIESAVNRLGYPLEERPFSPHLTIGRVRQNVTPAELEQIHAGLDSTRVNFPGKFTVGAVHLYKSDLRPEGAVYSRLLTAELGGKP